MEEIAHKEDIARKEEIARMESPYAPSVFCDVSQNRYDNYALLQLLREWTDEIEGIPLDLPPFATFEEEGLTTEQIAEIILHLQERLGYQFPLTWYPECLMDICDLALQRPRTLDKIREQERNYQEPHTFIPRQTLWQRLKHFIMAHFSL